MAKKAMKTARKKAEKKPPTKAAKKATKKATQTEKGPKTPDDYLTYAAASITTAQAHLHDAENQKQVLHLTLKEALSAIANAKRVLRK